MTEAQHQFDVPSPSQVPPEIQAAPAIAAATGGPGELVSTNAAKLETIHNEFAEFHEGYISRYIELADTKAAWAFAIASGSIAYIVGSELPGFLAIPWSLRWISFIVTVALFLASATYSFLVIAPRLGSSGETVVYFEAVAKRKSADDYVKDVASKNEAELAEARLKHCYDISRICTRKYGFLRRAALLGVPALAGLGVMLFLR